MGPFSTDATDPLLRFRESIRGEALRLGFARAGFTSAEPLAPSVERRWQRWLAEGKAGRMTYLLRPQPRRTHPRDLLPEAETAIVVLAGYHAGDHPPPPDECGTAGKVARYAWGRDYHLVLRERLTRLGEWIDRQAGAMSIDGPLTYRACVDSAPLDERALAVRAGLGFIGKNTLLLDPRQGSWSLIGILLISLRLPVDQPLRDPAATCGTCRRCLEACPTSALTGPYRLDPRRCISYLTIESREEIPAELAPRLDDWAFGCDVCQEVCPFNAAPLPVQLTELAADAGVGPYLTERELGAETGIKAFRRKWSSSPIARPGLKSLARTLNTLRNNRRSIVIKENKVNYPKESA